MKKIHNLTLSQVRNVSFCLFLAIVFCSVSWRPIYEINPVLSDSQIPVLSYHNVQENPKKPSEYFISTAAFEKQIKHLKTNGFHTVSPDDIYNHFVNGDCLPDKPIMLSFDDTRKEHYTIVAPILEKYGYKGAFFIMTIAIGKKNYMTSEEIKNLSDRGHYIGHHTLDHQNLKKLPLKDWETQIDKPKKRLEKIVGKKVQYLAYPFGLCNDFAAQELKKRNFKGAFQLSGKQLKHDPLMTIRRIIVPGTWNGQRLMKEITTAFK
jgi:peptidoglycan/xylan/chitin deacetylase (PgdA/CDA1 family)